MRRALFALAAVTLVAAATLASSSPASTSSKPVPPAAIATLEGDKVASSLAHNLHSPYSKQQANLRRLALEAKIEGKAKGKTHEVAKGQFVELAREGTDKIFTIIVEFGDERYPHPFFQDTIGGQPASNAQRFDGPRHNEIPEPDRAVDNTTIWKADFDKAHYEDMYFNRMAKYYELQSSGRYSVEGAVHGWVQVPFNQALYGRDYCGSIVCATSRALVRDALAVWVQQELGAGKTIGQIADYLRQFDEWDRYDIDGDGNFDEPDGFVDHFQIVHAGGDQAAGDPIYGTDAIWSHRSYANLQAGGPGGLVGVNVGTRGGLVSSTLVPNNPTGVWVGDYTVQPENGGLGVFAHEYGHDLGLDDLYDTSGNTGGAENSTAFWTLMSSGANIGDGGETIGDAPVNLGAFEKFQLGWLNYEVARWGQKSEHRLGPNGFNSKAAQGVFTILPASMNVDFDALGTPTSGEKAYWSGSGPNIDHSMTSGPISLPASGPLQASFKAWYEIEGCWDYAYLRVSTDGGTSWTNLTTSASDTNNPNGQNFGGGISGISGAPKACDDASGNPAWVDVTADLSPYAGQTVQLQFRYWTDPFVNGRGLEWDDLAITQGSTTVFSDDAESASGWTLDGFISTTGLVPRTGPHYYLAELRPWSYGDQSLRTSYNFGFLDSRPDWVEFAEYTPGVLINYWDTNWTDNNVGDHPGQGMILPIDAHQDNEHWADGEFMRNRIQSRDSAFGPNPVPAVTLHKNSVPTSLPAKPGKLVFDDLLDDWYTADDGHSAASHGRHQPSWTGVDVPETGTSIRVQSMSTQGDFAQIQVAPSQ